MGRSGLPEEERKERDPTFCDDEARLFSLRKSSEEARQYGYDTRRLSTVGNY